MECFAEADLDVPVTIFDRNSVNVTQDFHNVLKGGFVVHLLGIFADSSMAARVYVKKTIWFRTFALVFVSIYTLMWLAWLISLIVVRYKHTGKVCSGDYLSDDLNTGEPIEMFAIV